MMADVALFHSALGVRPGIDDAAERLTAAGHYVRVVDQYDGRVFDDYDEASAYVDAIGFPALMQVAVDGVADLAPGFAAVGFSNGAGMAEYVATQIPVCGVVMLSGALPLSMLDAESWPDGVPGQIHYALDDPFREQSWVNEIDQAIRRAGAECEVFDYPGTGHLFTDASLRDEYDAKSATLLWERVLEFCEMCSSTTGS